MIYSVQYKPKGCLFWRRLKRVKGDLIPSDMPGFRVFILEDESRVEIPIEGTSFMFCPKRFISIKQSMEKEAGQKLVGLP